MELTEEIVIHFTGNPSTIINGRALAGKGGFQLNETEDGTLLFGISSGGKYKCSVDFSNVAQPVARCTCPSRQNPCKHAVALMFHKLNGDKFLIGPIPEDIAANREKRAKKQSGVREAPAPAVMTRAKAEAAAKKCRVQLEGIAMAEKILGNIICAGLHSIDRENYSFYASQVKELGNYYVSGVQSAFSLLLSMASKGQLNQSFTEPIEQVNYIYALLKRGKSYTDNKLSDYEAFPETPDTALDLMLHSAIEEQLGYAWKLTELREKGLYIQASELLQLSFDSYDDSANYQFVDEGVWMVLNTGAIVYTFTYRPYKAQKLINAEDSFFQKLEIKELYIYPGAKNPRVRWDSENITETCEGDFSKAISYARDDYAQVIKEVKTQIISPLADKHPIFALRVSDLFSVGEDGCLCITDALGGKVILRLEKFGYLLTMASQSQVENGALTCRFTYDAAADLLYAVPLSLITAQGVIRFFY